MVGHEAKDSATHVDDIRGSFAAESTDRGLSRPPPDSEPSIGGPCKLTDSPVNSSRNFLPRLCVWRLLTKENVDFIEKSPDDERAVKILIENRLKNHETPMVHERMNLFVELAWSIVTFARNNSFTGEGVSAVVGIFHLTYQFFLSNAWLTARESYNFFYQTLLLHAVENPPKSRGLFGPEECQECLSFFARIFLGRLPLLRFVAMTNYRLRFVVASDDTRDE